MENCPFYQECKISETSHRNRSGIEKIIYNHYCCGEYQQCARHMVAEYIGAEKVPDDIYPIRWDKALRFMEFTRNLRNIFIA